MLVESAPNGFWIQMLFNDNFLCKFEPYLTKAIFLKTFPKQIQFKFPWRTYQQRVLDELKEHLDDNHLHVVAPPGSGKTVLGLEVAIRLNKPTLIFAPTIAIRNQWVDRFTEMFLQQEKTPDWISFDIKNPKFLTVSTYQALHAAFHQKDEAVSALLNRLKKQNIGTIVVDEAHHLQKVWWQSLILIKNQLEATIVGLTATPPYDVSHSEWQNYIELNGPVDTEIAVPELVKAGDLCPHQDYLFFSRPTVEEITKLNNYRERIKNLFSDLQKDKGLINAIANYPAIKQPFEQQQWIFSNVETYSAMLIFLNAVGKNIRAEHLQIIGNKGVKLPKLDYDWLQKLLSFYLFSNDSVFLQNEELQEQIKNKLRRHSALEKNTINFHLNHKLTGFLSTSINKMNSINRIVAFEYEQLQHNLRMVILTDYIRKEYLSENKLNKLDKIGAFPIFEKLRRANYGVKIGLLTGSLVIIPTSVLEQFKRLAKEFDLKDISTIPLAFDEQFVIIKPNDAVRHNIVHIVTQIFEQGNIEVLIGTKSLLGEGWDAPAINALILASFVGSFVLSNQMRGRAIRTQPGNPNKTSNIWHLVSIDPTVRTGGTDLETLSRRFKAFVGISMKDKGGIENGIGRFDLPKELWTDAQLEKVNERMFDIAKDREGLLNKWQKALGEGAQLVEQIKIPFRTNNKKAKRSYTEDLQLYFNRTIAYGIGLVISMISGFAQYVLESFLHNIRHFHTFTQLWQWLMYIGGVGVLVFGKLFYDTFRIWLTYRDISKDIAGISKALVETLHNMGIIKTPLHEIEIISLTDDKGAVYSYLKGASNYEKSIFIRSLSEIIMPIDNPRYVIIRKNRFVKIATQKDYHSVPELIGQHKKTAVFFAQKWRNYVGKNQLVYTRNIEGRMLLVHARMHALSSEFVDKTEVLNRWQ